MTAVVLVATELVVIVKVVCVWLAGTMTEAGGTADELFDERVTVAPPVGAGAGMTTTLLVVGLPPRIVFGLSER